jgi:hypothetical protein
MIGISDNSPVSPSGPSLVLTQFYLILPYRIGGWQRTSSHCNLSQSLSFLECDFLCSLEQSGTSDMKNDEAKENTPETGKWDNQEQWVSWGTLKRLGLLRTSVGGARGTPNAQNHSQLC